MAAILAFFAPCCSRHTLRSWTRDAQGTREVEVGMHAGVAKPNPKAKSGPRIEPETVGNGVTASKAPSRPQALRTPRSVRMVPRFEDCLNQSRRGRPAARRLAFARLPSQTRNPRVVSHVHPARRARTSVFIKRGTLRGTQSPLGIVEQKLRALLASNASRRHKPRITRTRPAHASTPGSKPSRSKPLRSSNLINPSLPR